jgi:hypothetical protein
MFFQAKKLKKLLSPSPKLRQKSITESGLTPHQIINPKSLKMKFGRMKRSRKFP